MTNQYGMSLPRRVKIQPTRQAPGRDRLPVELWQSEQRIRSNERVAPQLGKQPEDPQHTDQGNRTISPLPDGKYIFKATSYARRNPSALPSTLYTEPGLMQPLGTRLNTDQAGLPERQITHSLGLVCVKMA